VSVVSDSELSRYFFILYRFATQHTVYRIGPGKRAQGPQPRLAEGTGSSPRVQILDDESIRKLRSAFECLIEGGKEPPVHDPWPERHVRRIGRKKNHT
jgi:hypothetical protein